MENYQKAVSKIHRCCEESPRFQEIAQVRQKIFVILPYINVEEKIFCRMVFVGFCFVCLFVCFVFVFWGWVFFLGGDVCCC